MARNANQIRSVLVYHRPLTKGGGLYWWEASTGQWEHAGAKGVVLTPNIVLWMACPELPESMYWERPELDG